MMIQAWPLPTALPLFTQMQAAAWSHPESRLHPPPDPPPCPQLLSPNLHPLPLRFLAVESLARFLTLSEPQFFHL